MFLVGSVTGIEGNQKGVVVRLEQGTGGYGLSERLSGTTTSPPLTREEVGDIAGGIHSIWDLLPIATRSSR